MEDWIGKQVKICWRNNAYDWENFVLLAFCTRSSGEWIKLKGRESDGEFWTRLKDVDEIELDDVETDGLSDTSR